MKRHLLSLSVMLSVATISHIAKSAEYIEQEPLISELSSVTFPSRDVLGANLDDAELGYIAGLAHIGKEFAGKEMKISAFVWKLQSLLNDCAASMKDEAAQNEMKNNIFPLMRVLLKDNTDIPQRFEAWYWAEAGPTEDSRLGLAEESEVSTLQEYEQIAEKSGIIGANTFISNLKKNGKKIKPLTKPFFRRKNRSNSVLSQI